MEQAPYDLDGIWKRAPFQLLKSSRLESWHSSLPSIAKKEDEGINTGEHHLPSAF